MLFRSNGSAMLAGEEASGDGTVNPRIHYRALCLFRTAVMMCPFGAGPKAILRHYIEIILQKIGAFPFQRKQPDAVRSVGHRIFLVARHQDEGFAPAGAVFYAESQGQGFLFFRSAKLIIILRIFASDIPFVIPNGLLSFRTK